MGRRFISITSVVWLCVTAFYCYQYALRIIPNIIMLELFNKFNISSKEYGTFAGIYYIGYIIVHIPIGILLDRVGAKIILPVCIIITSCGLIPIIYSDSWHLALLGRLLTGIGSSGATVGALQLFVMMFHTGFARALGAMICFSLITVRFITKILSGLSFNSSLNILMIGGIILACMIFFAVPQTVKTHKKGILAEIKMVLSNYKLIGASVCAGLMVGPLEGFIDAWSSSMLRALYNISQETAHSVVSSILLGMAVGCIILPIIAERYAAYYSTTILSGCIMGASFICILFKISNDITVLYAVCSILGVSCAYQVVILAKIETYVSKNLSGLTGAIANMILMLFGPIFHGSIGFSMDQLWDGNFDQGIKIYSNSAYIKSMLIIPISISIAIMGLSTISILELSKSRQNH